MPIRYRTLALSIRFDAVIFPFETLTFLRGLGEMGYAFPEPPQPPLGARVDLGGVLGRKGGVSVNLDVDKMIVGVNASDPESLVGEFEGVEGLIEQKLDIKSQDIAKFYEVLAGAVVDSGNPPLEAFARASSEMPVLGRLSPILGSPLAPFGIRVSAPGQEPNQVDWFEVNICPDIQSGSRAYSVEVVFRRGARGDVVTFARSISEKIESLVAALER
jgi:hypothetical protein